MRIETAGSRAHSRARSRVVTTIPALPSAGWVWVPKVIVPPAMTGRSPSSPARVVGWIPSSASTTPVTFRPRRSSTGCMYRRWKARSSARASAYCSWRKSAISSCSARSIPASRATFSAVSIIANPACGSRLKFPMTGSSPVPVPPGAAGSGK